MKKVMFNLVFVLTVFLMTLASKAAVLGMPFSDDFEGYADQAALDAVWVHDNVVYDPVTLSTGQNHTPGGSRSISVYEGQFGQVYLSDTPITDVSVEVWFYDAGQAGTGGGVFAASEATNVSIGTVEFGIPIWISTTNYSYKDATDGWARVDSGIARTAGWHKVELCYTATGGSIYFDDNLVLNSTAMTSVKKVELGNPWAFAGSQPNPMYFDDINVSPAYKAFDPDPEDGASGVSTTPIISWLTGLSAVSHDVYFGTDFNDVNNATQVSSEFKGNQPGTTYSPSPILDLGTTYYWRIDEIDATETFKGDTWCFTVKTPVYKATQPVPADKAIDVINTTTLSWTAGATATSHNVYFGTDFDEVSDATQVSFEFKGNQPEATCAPGTLTFNTYYWWRIDEVDASDTYKGDVWMFLISPDCDTCPEGDINWDWKVDWNDIVLLCCHWLHDDCHLINNWCDGVDLNDSGEVDFVDLAFLAANWRKKVALGLVINEFMASNDHTVEDPDEQGEFPDWFEIYNTERVPVDMAGMYLTDDITNPTKWQIPEGVAIGAGKHLLFWADGESGQGKTHTSFKLSASDEQIGLFEADGITLMDCVSFGQQNADVSYGRLPDAGNNWEYFDVPNGIPTPGWKNEGRYLSDTGDSVVVFNELMYNPAPEDTGLEWVEFYNQMSYDVDLSDWSVIGEIDYDFPEGTIIPGRGFLLVASSPACLAANTGYAGAEGPFNGRLSKNRGKIWLRNNSKRTMDVLDYRDGGDWPVAPDGGGVSLAKLDSDTGTGPSENWGWSAQTGGTPGQQNDIYEADGLAFNEVSSAVVPVGAFWIELVNRADRVIDVNGYVLSCRGIVTGQYVLPSYSLNPNDYLIINESSLGFHPADEDRLFLYAPGQDVVADAVVVENSHRGRYPQGTGRWLYPDVQTPGSVNSFAFHGEIVINEIMYHHKPNLGTAEIPTSCTTNALISIDDTWRYNQTGDDLGSNWYQSTHRVDGVNWFSGQGLLALESSPLPEPILTDLTVSASQITYYFETEFNFDGVLEDLDILQLRHIIDDGAVFYLNGVEVLRFNMPQGLVDAATLTSVAVTDAVYVGPVDIDKDALIVGSNRLAVEVHECNATSTDIVFGIELLAGVINEPGFPATDFSKIDEEWIELYNRSGTAIDLTDWSLNEGIEYSFSYGTTIAPRGYVIVTNDEAGMEANYPELNPDIIVGDFEMKLSNKGEPIVLVDSNKNLADEVRYYDGGRWSNYADGDGSSLELRDPRADNSKPEAWAASDEGSKTQWKTYTYRGIASQIIGPSIWNELCLGFLYAGEVLLDDISVIEDPDGAALELIQNGSFEGGTAEKWRFLGNHRHCQVIVDPNDPTDHVLHIKAKGRTETRHNHIETTFVGNRAIVDGREYEISFKAKWIGGSSQLNTRLYFIRLAHNELLEVPVLNGTPGALNSRYEANIGPTFSGFGHSPVVPNSGDPVTVSLIAEDPDGVDSCVLWWRLDGASWNSESMSHQGSGLYTAAIPGQSGSTVVQFYVWARDGLMTASTCPKAGEDSRAMYRVEDGQAWSGQVHDLRVIMPGSEVDFMFESTNLMSSDPMPATVIYDEREVYYDVGVRLKGSHWRRDDNVVGYTVTFNEDQLFRGVQDSVAIDRSGREPVTRGQDEIYIKHMLNKAGVPCMYDDLINFIAPRSDHTGSALMLMSRYERNFLESQWENGDEGTVFELDGIEYPTTTVDGNPESMKPATSSAGIYPDFADFGDDKETYRVAILIKNNRQRDDYSGLIDFCKTMDLPEAQLEAQIEQVMDVDEWMRCCAMRTVCGLADQYGFEFYINIRVYVRTDQKVVALPWDMDFVFALPYDYPPLVQDRNISRVAHLAEYKRLNYGHLKDVLDTIFNTDYMTYWMQHYSSLLPGQDFTTQLPYIEARHDYVLSQLPVEAPFEVTDFSVLSDTVTVDGSAWINVKEIYVNESSEPLKPTWTSSGSGVDELFFWHATVPIELGQTQLTFAAYDFRGNLIIVDSIAW